MKNPNKMVVCPRCKGRGGIANPAFDGMSTHEIYEDMGYEEGREFLEEYLKPQGMYDLDCPCCHGVRVVTKKFRKEWLADEADRREMEAEMRAEMRYCGLY